MKSLDIIDENLKKIEILSKLHDDIINSNISSPEKLQIAKLKAKVAKDDIMKMLHENSKILHNLKDGCV